MARGVHGMMDLTVPGGGASESVTTATFSESEDGTDESKASGRMKRMLGDV